MATETTNLRTEQDRSPDQRTTRREAVKVGAAVAAGAVAAAYVSPALRSLGVPSALAISSGLPPSGGETAACTPGYWGNSPKGKDLWDIANDPDWTSKGGKSAQPFYGGQAFSTYFTPVQSAYDPTGLMGQSMLYFASNGATSNWIEKAARDVVAGTLNAAFFGSAFAYSASQIASAWTSSVNVFDNSGGTDTSAFEDLHNKLGGANQAVQCPL